MDAVCTGSRSLPITIGGGGTEFHLVVVQHMHGSSNLKKAIDKTI
jgi:hypothetical protein